MDASLTAKKIAARFEGPEGARLLRDIIQRQPLTGGKPDIVEQLAYVAKIEPYETSEIIIQQDETDTDIYFILSGSVTVSPNGRPDTTRSAGTHVGEMATIDPSARRSAKVHANEPTVVARISEADFSKVANTHPFIWRYLARELADRLRQRVAKVPLRKQRSRVFLASSSEGLKTAEALQIALGEDPLDVTIWTKGIFTAGLTNIEALETELVRADFAVLLLSPDDKIISRGVASDAPRDNLILEVGLFAGALGRRRAIMVCPKDLQLKIPTDLLGVNPIMYTETDMVAVAAELRAIFEALGPK
jgi:predicted nucleotide-binding protein